MNICSNGATNISANAAGNYVMLGDRPEATFMACNDRSSAHFVTLLSDGSCSAVDIGELMTALEDKYPGFLAVMTFGLDKNDELVTTLKKYFAG